MRIYHNQLASGGASTKASGLHPPLQVWLRWSVVLGIAALLLGLSVVTARATFTSPSGWEQTGGTVPPGGPIWTRWHPNQYALAEESDALWIGAAGNVVRWDKQRKTHRRYTKVDGLPHQDVYAVAIDGAGNRWFGGDGGLSRLDANNDWTHYTTTNSGLVSNLVDGIAVGADNTLWVSHGLPDGSVSRRDPDGAWHSYPNRTVAVVTDYDQIQQTRNANRLWMVAGAEIWVGYLVYDGNLWYNRTPENAQVEPEAIAVDSQGVVWVMGRKTYGSSVVYRWRGSQWSVITEYAYFEELTTLVVSDDDTVWVGGRCGVAGRGITYFACAKRLQDQPPFQRLPTMPLTALLPDDNGIWAIGPGWLLQPDGVIYKFQDTPTYLNVIAALVGVDDELWIASHQPIEQLEDLLQTVDDQGTAILEDDVWQVRTVADLPVNNRRDELMTVERTPGGELWVAGRGNTPLGSTQAYLLHQHQGEWIKHELPIPYVVVITDLFAYDEERIWAAYHQPIFEGVDGVLALDTQGTPADLQDDTWTDYPFSGGAVAVDAGGHLWYGNSSGLYQSVSGQWQIRSEAAICDLAPASNGILFAQLAGYRESIQPDCSVPNPSILRIESGISEVIPLDTLVKTQLDVVRSAGVRNRLWTVAPDGAVWYFVSNAQASPPQLQALQRHSATGVASYPLPFDGNQVPRLEVDAHNHAWMVTNNGLWRMILPADFTLTVQPPAWLLAPGEPRSGHIVVGRQGEFNDQVTLAMSGLPSGLMASLTPNPIDAGNSVTVIMHADGEMALGTYPATLIGVSNHITHTIPLTLQVVAEVFEQHLPLVSH